MSDVIADFEPECSLIYVGEFDSIDNMKDKPFLPEKGHFIFCRQEEQGYYYNGKEWEPISAMDDIHVQGKGIEMSLGDLNKNAMASLPDLEITEKVKNQIEEFKKQTGNEKYYMLLCRERSYYTIFTPAENGQGEAGFADSVLECAACLGTLKSVDSNAGYVEFWCQSSEEVVCALLFPYEQGVVEYNE